MKEAAPRVMHAFRLGPLSSSGDGPIYAYVGLTEGGEPCIREASSDATGLEGLKGDAAGQPLSCEPALAEAGKRLGLESVPLPAGVLKARADLAFQLASGLQPGASRPEAIAALLKGAAAFWTARSWEVIGPEERLHVAFLEGHAEVEGEISVVGGDGTRLPGVALCDAPGVVKDLAKLQGQARAEVSLRLANLTADMEREPAWAVEVIEQGYGLDRMPSVARRRGGEVAPAVTQDLLVAAALLEAIAAWTGLEDQDAVGEGTAAAAGMRVVARVRSSEDLPGPPSEGLTPVGADAAPGGGDAPPVEADAAPGGAEGRNAGEKAAAAAPAVEPAQAAAPSPSVPAAAQTVSPIETSEMASPAAAAPPAVAPSPPAPRIPEPALPPPAPKIPEPATSPPAPRPAQPPGWLTRAWRSLFRKDATGVRRSPSSTPRAPSRRATRTAAARPAPSPAPAVDGSDPFAPFARALRIELPAEPPAPAPADEAALADLVGRVIEAAKADTGELVSFPAVAVEIVDRVHDPKADARSVAGFISRDPALAADVVSVANSAAFRGVSEIESVHEAVARLGLAEVGRVASAVAARKLFEPQGGRSEVQAATGHFVRAVAVATAAASASLRQRGARSDRAWLGGLLHDVGKALVVQILARLAAEPGAHLTPIALEGPVVERAHVEVGKAAIRRWALPGYLLEICAHHHDATVAGEAVDLHLIRVASALASLRDAAVAARASREIVQSAGALGMDAAAVRALAADLKAASERARMLVLSTPR